MSNLRYSNSAQYVTCNHRKVEEFPFQSELALEGYLADNPAALSLNDELGQPTQLSAESRISVGDQGRIDLLVVYDDDVLGIAELKRYELTTDSYDQLKRYIKHKDSIDFKATSYIGLLIGKTVSKDLMAELGRDNYCYEGVPIIVMTVSRYAVGNDTFVFLNKDMTGIKTIAGKDYTKFSLHGEGRYGKSELVYRVIKKYVEDHPDVTVEDLMNVFPPSLQGNRGCLTTYDEAEKIFDDTGYKRHRLNTPITLNNGTKVVACTQWGVGNIEGFVEKAIKLGYEINVIKK